MRSVTDKLPLPGKSRGGRDFCRVGKIGVKTTTHREKLTWLMDLKQGGQDTARLTPPSVHFRKGRQMPPSSNHFQLPTVNGVPSRLANKLTTIFNPSLEFYFRHLELEMLFDSAEVKGNFSFFCFWLKKIKLSDFFAQRKACAVHRSCRLRWHWINKQVNLTLLFHLWKSIGCSSRSRAGHHVTSKHAQKLVT